MYPTRARVLRSESGPAQPRQPAAGGTAQPQQELEQSRLAGPVGAQERKDLTRLDAKLISRKAPHGPPRCQGERYDLETLTNSAARVCHGYLIRAICTPLCKMFVNVAHHVRGHLRIRARDDLVGCERRGGTGLSAGVVLHRLQRLLSRRRRPSPGTRARSRWRRAGTDSSACCRWSPVAGRANRSGVRTVESLIP